MKMSRFSQVLSVGSFVEEVTPELGFEDQVGFDR